MLCVQEAALPHALSKQLPVRVGAGLGAEACVGLPGGLAKAELDGACQSLVFQDTIRAGQKLYNPFYLLVVKVGDERPTGRMGLLS